MALIIRSSSIHAAGCYTTAPIAKGALVLEYTGRRISKKAADKKYENYPVTYLFGIKGGETVIDGHGLAMFLNHCCRPNCQTEEMDDGRVWIKALRAIEAGEELTYDYYLYDGGDDEALCNCGSSRCRGTMYSPEEIKRRKALARRAKERAKKAAARRKLAAKLKKQRKG